MNLFLSFHICYICMRYASHFYTSIGIQALNYGEHYKKTLSTLREAPQTVNFRHDRAAEILRKFFQ